MKVKRLDRPHPTWTIARANHVMYHGQTDRDATSELAALPALSADWRHQMEKRLSTLTA